MSLALFTTLLSIGLVGSFVSGMLGIGGSIVKYPLLLYIPPALGPAMFSTHEVSGISAVQVLFSSIAGVLAYRNDRVLNTKLIVYMGSSILFASFFGAYMAKFMPEGSINLVYAVLATVAAIMMFAPKLESSPSLDRDVSFNIPVAVGSAAIIGFFSGIVGAAGAFILVPVMLLVLKIPVRMTIASSLAITLISSIGSTAGKLLSGHVLFGPALIMIWASILGAPLGAKVGKRINTKVLQWILGVLIVATSVKIWLDIAL
ncbi:sulfite exporter TauE/SafE family protein [Alicyclobacillus ferrooxydans]|uniref:Probable membrane transporter protein n=1 Tax=Alicyclobacillus ferrooxydans TaxID=471514 RepID=A0A0P9GUK5_9BACL|nr:sulfite exporter TauE/SafE family protein [Alicyclobacillus ferrooxydans]KPV44950.1 hypothetical protein AN477_04930 [Alicyclobacillus ferrooxydans]